MSIVWQIGNDNKTDYDFLIDKARIFTEENKRNAGNLMMRYSLQKRTSWLMIKNRSPHPKLNNKTIESDPNPISTLKG